MVEMQAVKSSSIAAVGYDQETKELRVQFTRGQTYVYRGVSPEVHKALMDSESIGKHFQANIRNQFTGELLGSVVPA